MLLITTAQESTKLYILFQDIFFPETRRSKYAVDPTIFQFRYNNKCVGVYEALLDDLNFSPNNLEDQFIPFIESTEEGSFYFLYKTRLSQEWEIY